MKVPLDTDTSRNNHKERGEWSRRVRRCNTWYVQNKFQVLILLEDIRCNKKRKSTANFSFLHQMSLKIHSLLSFYCVARFFFFLLLSCSLFFYCTFAWGGKRITGKIRIFLVKECNNNERDLEELVMLLSLAWRDNNHYQHRSIIITRIDTSALNCPLKQV